MERQNLLVGWHVTEADIEKVRSRLPSCDPHVSDRRPDLQYFECDKPSLRRLLLEADILMGWIAPTGSRWLYRSTPRAGIEEGNPWC